MSNRHLGSVSLLLASALFAACIPGRDNPYDPAAAPHAALVAIDATAPAGGCLTSLADAEARGPTDRIARTRCLLLDATSSRDSARGVLGSGASFEFAVVDSAGRVAHGIDAAPLLLQGAGAARSLFVDSSVLRDIPPGPTRFRVRVRDGGHVGDAIESVRVENVAPAIRIEGARAIPISGPAWAPAGASTASVSFAARSADPEGRPLASRCWTFEPAGGSSCAGDVATASVPVGAASRVVGTFAATDADGTTTTAVTALELATSVYWRVGVRNQQRTTRDADRAGIRSTPVIPVLGGNGSTSLGAAWLPDAGGFLGSYVRSVGPFNSSILAFEPFPPGPAIATTSSNFGSGLFAAIPGAPAAWSVIPGELGRIVIQGNAPHLAETIQIPDADRVAATLDGAAWLRSGTAVVRVRSGGTIEARDFAPETIVELAPRPGTDELWALTRDSGTWSLYRAHGSSTPLDFALVYGDLGSPTAMTWSSDGSLWLALASEGLFRFAVPALEASAPFDEAVTLAVPLDGVVALTPDPFTGAVLAVGDATLLVDASGLAFTIPASLATYPPLFIDPWGDAWTSGLANYGGVPSFDASSAPGAPDVVAHAFTVTRSDESVDGFGRLWTADADVPAATIYDANGRLMENISVPGFAPVIVRPSLDGTYAWLGSDDRIALVRRDPTGSVDLGFVVPSGARAILGNVGATSFRPGVIVPSAPGAPPFAWAVAFTTSAQVLVIDTAGGESVIARLPPQERTGTGFYSLDARGALLPRSNRLCLADVEDSASPLLHVRVFDRTGLVAEGPSIALDPADQGSLRVISLSTAVDGAGESCWIGVAPLFAPLATSTWNVYVYDASAKLVVSHGETNGGKLDSLVAISSTAARATIERDGVPTLPNTVESEIDFSGTTATVQDLYTRPGGMVLVGPLSDPGAAGLVP